MNWSHYRFRSVWDLPAPPGAVYTALEQVDAYPRWWPQVRAVTRLDENTGVVRVRSFLPYELVVAVREKRRAPEAGVLEVAISGDMDGWARWTVRPRGADGTRAVYEQEVEVRKALVRRLAVPGRPLLIANHALMMRGGRRALAAALAV
ncbi:SRPBCC family protein [Streptomyces chryseus]|uniref:SRPBCC family protein n=1 Tax=Streptomyces chryseus TaxID=68186 RepID=UPI00110F9DE2|nr:SRPBCC family protein [Streptomyces chryseus]GGW90159.1 polyketide cyclase [Streptomyces chryseus]